MEDSKNSSFHMASSEVKPESSLTDGQPISGVIVLLESIAACGCTSFFEDGKPTPNRELCLRFAAELRALPFTDLERDSARFQWVGRNWNAGGLLIDRYGPEFDRPGYLLVELVDGIEYVEGEERYATYGEAVDAAIAREKTSSRSVDEASTPLDLGLAD